MKEKKLKKGTPEYEIAKLQYAVDWREKYIAQLKRGIEAHEELEGIYSAWIAALIGAAGTALTSGKHPGKLQAEVCSPAGTTIAGVRTLEQRGFRAAAMDAVIAAYERTKELAGD